MQSYTDRISRPKNKSVNHSPLIMTMVVSIFSLADQSTIIENKLMSEHQYLQMCGVKLNT